MEYITVVDYVREEYDPAVNLVPMEAWEERMDSIICEYARIRVFADKEQDAALKSVSIFRLEKRFNDTRIMGIRVVGQVGGTLHPDCIRPVGINWRTPEPWYSEDGDKWCSCGDGIAVNEVQCDTCRHLNDIAD